MKKIISWQETMLAAIQQSEYERLKKETRSQPLPRRIIQLFRRKATRYKNLRTSSGILAERYVAKWSKENPVTSLRKITTDRDGNPIPVSADLAIAYSTDTCLPVVCCNYTKGNVTYLEVKAFDRNGVKNEYASPQTGSQVVIVGLPNNIDKYVYPVIRAYKTTLLEISSALQR